ncbi:MAG: plastocyanin/azurin family copper-binding protein, partial [Chloroflexota bacterium]|nr:plastocyanin/azurin family copper-binding protein [Chloroflexota bacterium]
VIELEMTASLRFAQAGQPIDSLALTEGETYTFRVTNTAGFVHNIWLGPPDRLLARDTDGLPGLDDYESGTQEFSWTATGEAQGWEFGCTVPGHYEAGMKGALELGADH